jgi:hypothetical protein
LNRPRFDEPEVANAFEQTRIELKGGEWDGGRVTDGCFERNVRV